MRNGHRWSLSRSLAVDFGSVLGNNFLSTADQPFTANWKAAIPPYLIDLYVVKNVDGLTARPNKKKVCGNLSTFLVKQALSVY